MTWSQGTNDTIIFNITQSWRWSFYGNPPLGNIVNVGSMTFGDGTSGTILLTINSINSSQDWFSGTTTIKKKYAASGTYTAQYTNCCRISTLLNGNNDRNSISRVTVTAGNGNNPPVSLAPPIINLPLNVPSTYLLPGFDPDGNTYTFSITPPASSGLLVASPAGLTLSPTGVINWTPTVAGLYAMNVTITDNLGASSNVDFLLFVSTMSSNPPVFDYTSGNTPANNQVFTVSPGNNVNFNVVANDIDPGSTVTLSVVGLPASGYTLTPALPTTANPVSTSFSWTPTGLQTGNYVLAFTATDNTTAQTTTNVIINVPAVSPPAFVVPPTPIAGTGSCIEVGTTRIDTIRASNTFSGANTRITSVAFSGPVTGATLSPAVPTAYQPIASTVLSWTPVASEWQLATRTVTAVATDANNLSTNHSFFYLINSVPVITSGAPTGVAYVGQPYTFTITATDADMAAGDTLDAHGSMLPSWVSVTKIGPGSFLVSGTPGCSDTGHVHFEVGIEDIHHHCPNIHVDEHFHIDVEDNTDPIIVCPTSIQTYNADMAGCTLSNLPVLSASDNCGVQSVQVSPTGPYGVGQHTVTWTATDIHGNTSTCQQTFLVAQTVTTGSSSIVQCDSYTWNSQTYTTSGAYTGTFVNALGCDSVHTLNLTIPSGVYLDVSAWLAGAYDAAQGLMHDSLRVNNLIPASEPYSPPSVYNVNPVSGPGGETIGVGVLATTGPGAVVDWMLVEIRQAANPMNLLANVRGLIRRDGVITATDGISALFVPNIYPGNYYVSVKHRNHLGVMTANPVLLSGCSPTSIDFRTATPVYVKPGVNNAPRKVVGSARLLWSMDANFNKNVRYNGIQNDKEAVATAVGLGTLNNTVYGYRREDGNMDGKVRYNGTDNDRIPMLDNIGVSTPNNILSQHTPN